MTEEELLALVNARMEKFAIALAEAQGIATRVMLGEKVHEAAFRLTEFAQKSGDAEVDALVRCFRDAMLDARHVRKSRLQ